MLWMCVCIGSVNEERWQASRSFISFRRHNSTAPKIEKFNGRQPPQSTHKNMHLIRYVKQIDPLNYSIRYSFCLSHCGGGGGYDFFVYRGTTGNKMDLTRGSILNYGGLKAFIVQIKSQLL